MPNPFVSQVAWSTPFDPNNRPELGLTKNNVQEEIEELADISGVSASPGFSWGRSGNVSSGAWLQNDSVPSNLSGRNFPLYGGSLMQLSVSNELANTFDISIYEHDGVTYTLLATISLVAQRSKSQTYTGVSVTRNKELAIKVTSGACKNPVVQAILKSKATP